MNDFIFFYHFMLLKMAKLTHLEQHLVCCQLSMGFALIYCIVGVMNF